MQELVYRPAATASSSKGMFSYLAGVLRLWRERHNSRQALSQLDLAAMKDVGLDPEWVRNEIEKPFWRG